MNGIMAVKCRLDPTVAKNKDKACDVACRWQDKGDCIATSDYMLTAHGTGLHDITLCITSPRCYSKPKVDMVRQVLFLHTRYGFFGGW